MVDVAAVMTKPYTVELLERQPLARVAYTAKDGSPRVIPIGCVWDGAAFLMWTIPTSAKVAALRADPRVALTEESDSDRLSAPNSRVAVLG